NSNRIERRRFLEDAGNVVLERVRNAVERHGSVKVNTAFNGDFVTKDKSWWKYICASLDKLASYLDKDKLKIVRSEFSTLSDEEFELLTRKGVFPHEYIDCTEKLQDSRLLPRELFFNSSTGDTYPRTITITP
ncbi:hypothetical protein ALC57_16827, partial [Trachymyrmex cornetzi]